MRKISSENIGKETVSPIYNEVSGSTPHTSSKPSNTDSKTSPSLHYQMKFKLIQMLLIGIFIILISAVIFEPLRTFHLVEPNAADKLFDIFREDMVPILTLLIGFLFGRKS